MTYDSKTKQMEIILRNELQQTKMMRKHQMKILKLRKQYQKARYNNNQIDYWKVLAYIGIGTQPLWLMMFIILLNN
jgi:hypothetical protein